MCVEIISKFDFCVPMIDNKASDISILWVSIKINNKIIELTEVEKLLRNKCFPICFLSYVIFCLFFLSTRVHTKLLKKVLVLVQKSVLWIISRKTNFQVHRDPNYQYTSDTDVHYWCGQMVSLSLSVYKSCDEPTIIYLLALSCYSKKQLDQFKTVFQSET